VSNKLALVHKIFFQHPQQKFITEKELASNGNFLSQDIFAE